MSYPQQQYPGGGYTPASGGGTNPATAIIAALLALAVAAFQVIFLVKSFSDGLSLGDLPAEALITYGVTAVGGLLSLLGAMFTFGRKVAGAILVIIGALVSVAGVFLFPVMLSSAAGGGRSIPFGRYLESLFKFGGAEQTVFALTLIVGPLAFIFAIIPPTLRHLRGGGGADTSYGDPYQQQQQQQAYPGYNPSPNSGGFPQQDYPGYQQPQQGGYPQQPQQGGGYPPQQQGW